MHKTMKRFVATLLAAVTVAAPAKASGMDAGKYCSTYDQVESNATGGDYVGGILVYEKEATVTRPGGTTTTTTSTTTGGSTGVPGTNVTASTTVTTTTTTVGTTTSGIEPVGIYAMNDGSTYEINCVTGEYRQLTPSRG